MMSLARVSLLGNDLTHLESRASVLRHFWTVKTVALDSGEIPELETDVIVVCETLPEAERQSWVERARQEAPNLLVVKVNGYDSGPQAGADAVVDAQHGPGALVATIYELTMERGLLSRAWPLASEPTTVQ